MSLTMASDKIEKEAESIQKDIQGSFIYQVLEKRIRFHNLKMSLGVKILLMQLSPNPATLVMYVMALKWKYPGEGYKLTLQTLVALFPSGFLSEERLSKLWDLQKT